MKKISNKKSKFVRTQGFTLIEVLITVVVLSIGLLGLASLQAASLQSNNNSIARSQAAILASDMADRVRANIQGRNAGSYHLPAAAAVGACAIPPGCTAAQLAQNDAAEWNAAITQALAGGQGVVCIDSTRNPAGTSTADHQCDGVGPLFVIKLWWDDDRNPATPNQQFITSFQP